MNAVRETHEARNGSVLIVYDVRGEGTPLLLIHGLGYDRFGWGPAPDLLARSHRVIVFDNRGLGESDVPPGPYTVAGMAEDALAVLDAASFERAHVLGTSLGGLIAQEFALAWPERVDRLVLACTTPGGAEAYPMPERTVRAFTVFQTMPRADGLRMLVENALADASVASRSGLVDEIFAYRLAHSPPDAGWQAQAQAAFFFNAFERIPRLAMPTLVLHGTEDNVVDYRNSELLAERIPNARLELFPGTGHLFFWEEPERVASAIADFLADEA